MLKFADKITGRAGGARYQCHHLLITVKAGLCRGKPEISLFQMPLPLGGSGEKGRGHGCGGRCMAGRQLFR